MKDSKRCPKCDSRDIVRLPMHSNVINSGKGMFGTLSSENMIIPSGYLCCQCGLVESYVEFSEDRQKVKDRYAENKPKLPRKRKRTKTFRVGKKKKVKAPPLPQEATQSGDIEARLQRLEDLKEKGLVSEEEFLAKRREIIGGSDGGS